MRRLLLIEYRTFVFFLANLWRPAHDLGTLDPEACGARAAVVPQSCRAVLREAGHGRFFVKSALSAVGAGATLEVAISVRGAMASEERPGWQ